MPVDSSEAFCSVTVRELRWGVFREVAESCVRWGGDGGASEDGGGGGGGILSWP